MRLLGLPAVLLLLSLAAAEDALQASSLATRQADGRWVVSTTATFVGWDETRLAAWRASNALFVQLRCEDALYTSTERGWEGDKLTLGAIVSPGAYAVTVTELLLLRTPRGSPHDHRLVGTHEVRVGGKAEAARQPLHSCTAVGESANWFDGYWNTSDPSLPVYVPRACTLDWFSAADVAALSVSPRPRPVWIHVFGNSKERGVYNRLLDLALVRADKTELVNSVTVKCSGWIDVTLAHLRLSFLDFRAQNYWSPDTLCHDGEVSSSPQIHLPRADALAFWEHLFSAHDAQPDVVWLSGDRAGQVPLSNYEAWLAVAARSGWAGRLVYGRSDTMPNSGAVWLACARDTDTCRAARAAEAARLAATYPHIVLADLSAVQMSSADQMEQPKSKAGCWSCSNHYHHGCEAAERPERNVCGRVADAVAQVLYNAAFGRREEALRSARLISMDEAELARRFAAAARPTVCVDCPRFLAPIHVTKQPQPRCYEAPLQRQKGDVGPAYPPPRCPCIDQEPESTIALRAGAGVEVRRCAKVDL